MLLDTTVQFVFVWMCEWGAGSCITSILMGLSIISLFQQYTEYPTRQSTSIISVYRTHTHWNRGKAMNECVLSVYAIIWKCLWLCEYRDYFIHAHTHTYIAHPCFVFSRRHHHENHHHHLSTIAHPYTYLIVYALLGTSFDSWFQNANPLRIPCLR